MEIMFSKCCSTLSVFLLYKYIRRSLEENQFYIFYNLSLTCWLVLSRSDFLPSQRMRIFRSSNWNEIGAGKSAKATYSAQYFKAKVSIEIIIMIIPSNIYLFIYWATYFRFHKAFMYLSLSYLSICLTQHASSVLQCQMPNNSEALVKPRT